MKNVKFTFLFTEEEATYLQNLADERSVFRTQILRDGLKLVKMIDEASKNGWKVLVEKDGVQSEVKIL